jgi:hydroxyethylthiazole kinase-like sugar kinase family protein
MLPSQCDELAQETSCWLFFSAQHINANEAFLHYSSPRLVKEERKEVEDLTNDFNKLYINLMAARQRNAAEMSKKLQAAEEKQASTSKALDEAAQELETARKDAAEEKKRLEEQIEYYKTLLKP